MKQINYYGPKIFDEIIIDPIKTMKKDILPRFLVSFLYDRMIHNLLSCDPPPPSANMSVPPPSTYNAYFMYVCM